MSHSTTSLTGLTSQYAKQVAGDLEHNAKEQERITTEITALQQQLASLQQDHTILVSMQQALGIAATTPKPADNDNTTVPSPRKKTPAEPRKQTRKATAEQPTDKKPAAGKRTAGNTARKTVQPTLVELVGRHLTERTALSSGNLHGTQPVPPRPRHQDHRRAHHPRESRRQEPGSAHQARKLRLLHRHQLPRAHADARTRDRIRTS